MKEFIGFQKAVFEQLYSDNKKTIDKLLAGLRVLIHGILYIGGIILIIALGSIYNVGPWVAISAIVIYAFLYPVIYHAFKWYKEAKGKVLKRYKMALKMEHLDDY